MWEIEVPLEAEPLGYKKLVSLFALGAVTHFRWSYASLKWEKREVHFNDQNMSLYIYPCSYRLSDDVFEHLEFALKHEGVNLYILKKVLESLSFGDLLKHISKKQTGKYARILWYLYEKFTNKVLPLNDLLQGTFVPLLDPKEYYTGESKRSARHRIADNLLGTLDFAPMIRRSPRLRDAEKKDLGHVAHNLAKQYEPSVLERAMRYLYTKETMSSWEIEKEKPDNSRLVKFVGLLHKAAAIGPLSEKMLVGLQKDILDSRFTTDTYRDFQNYVGEEPRMGQLILHYIPPKPEDVSFFMQHLIATFDLMEKVKINPVIATAVISFGFVYIHPFEDGNGRIHRFLIHYGLARCKFIPEGFVFPVSAVILRDPKQYDKVLEAFSKSLLELVTNYKVSDMGELKVLQDSRDYYRYIDFTKVAEYLFDCVEKTILTDFKEELSFLSDYDKIKKLCKEIIDMSDWRLDLFIRCVRQNGGKLSQRKQEAYFSMLTESEIKEMETIIQKNFSLD